MEPYFLHLVLNIWSQETQWCGRILIWIYSLENIFFLFFFLFGFFLDHVRSVYFEHYCCCFDFFLLSLMGHGLTAASWSAAMPSGGPLCWPNYLILGGSTIGDVSARPCLLSCTRPGWAPNALSFLACLALEQRGFQKLLMSDGRRHASGPAWRRRVPGRLTGCLAQHAAAAGDGLR